MTTHTFPAATCKRCAWIKQQQERTDELEARIIDLERNGKRRG